MHALLNTLRKMSPLHSTPSHFYTPLFKFPTNEHTTQINIHIVIQVYTFVSLLFCMCAMFYICIGQYPLNVMLSHLLHIHLIPSFSAPSTATHHICLFVFIIIFMLSSLSIIAGNNGFNATCHVSARVHVSCQCACIYVP